MLLSCCFFVRNILSPSFLKIKVKRVIPTPASKTFNNETLTIFLTVWPQSIHSAHCSLLFSWNAHFRCFPSATLLCSHYSASLQSSLSYSISMNGIVNPWLFEVFCINVSQQECIFIPYALYMGKLRLRRTQARAVGYRHSQGLTSASLWLENTLRTTTFYCLCRFSWIQPRLFFT